MSPCESDQQNYGKGSSHWTGTPPGGSKVRAIGKPDRSGSFTRKKFELNTKSHLPDRRFGQAAVSDESLHGALVEGELEDFGAFRAMKRTARDSPPAFASRAIKILRFTRFMRRFRICSLLPALYDFCFPDMAQDAVKLRCRRNQLVGCDVGSLWEGRWHAPRI